MYHGNNWHLFAPLYVIMIRLKCIFVYFFNIALTCMYNQTIEWENNCVRSKTFVYTKCTYLTPIFCVRSNYILIDKVKQNYSLNI